MGGDNQQNNLIKYMVFQTVKNGNRTRENKWGGQTGADGQV